MPIHTLGYQALAGRRFAPRSSAEARYARTPSMQSHVAEGQRHVEEQRARVGELESQGHDTTQAILLLGQFEEMLALRMIPLSIREGWFLNMKAEGHTPNRAVARLECAAPAI